MPNSSKKLSFRIFDDDDTNIFFSSKNPNEVESVMNNELKQVLKYCAINKLSVDMKKTNYMIITSPQKPHTNINILNIKQKKCIKYLGIYLDEHLNWKKQIDHVSSKIAKNIGILYKLRHYLNLHMLKQLYYTLIYPYINYGAASWGNTYPTNLKKICSKQNQCIRSIFFAANRESANIFYELLSILKFDNIVKLKISSFVHKIITDPSSVPILFRDTLQPTTSVHNYNTRHATKKNLYRPKIRTNFGKFSFRYSATVIWETVPYQIKQASHLNFPKLYKAYLLQHQQ